MNRTVGNLHIYDNGSRLILRAYGKGASISPRQAIFIAGEIENDRYEEVEFLDGSTEERLFTYVLRVKHSNCVFPINLGILRHSLIIGDWIGYTPGAYLKRYFSGHTIYFDDKQIEVLQGLFYYWAGTKLIGNRIVKQSTKRKSILWVDDKDD